MSKFNSKSPIPAVPGAARIDVRYGGTVDQVERESVAIAEAYMSTLSSRKSLLYINTLSPDVEMGSMLYEFKKSLRTEQLRERFRFETFEGDEIIERKHLIVDLVEEFNLRVLILNSFDFASTSYKNRRRLFNTLKFLRDHLRLHIIVYTRREPKRAEVGVMSDLAWLAASVSPMESSVLVATPRKKTVSVAQPMATEQGLETIDVMKEIDYLEVAQADKTERALVGESADDLNDWRKKAIRKYTIQSVDQDMHAMMFDDEPHFVAVDNSEVRSKKEEGRMKKGESGAAVEAATGSSESASGESASIEAGSSASASCGLASSGAASAASVASESEYYDDYVDEFTRPLDPNDPEEAALIAERSWKTYLRRE
jgi:hypothetical protein